MKTVLTFFLPFLSIFFSVTFLNDSVFELKDCSLNLIRNHSKGDKVSIYVHQNLKDKVKDDLKD